MSRIDGKASLIEAIAAMSEGNPGAATALVEIYNAAQEGADPDSVWDGLGPLLQLDRMKIYGPLAWVLYKDLCAQDPVKVLAALRYEHLGLRPPSWLVDTIKLANEGKGDLAIWQTQYDESLAVLKQFLPSFRYDLLKK